MEFLNRLGKRPAIFFLYFILGFCALIISPAVPQARAQFAASESSVRQLMDRSQQLAAGDPDKAVDLAERALEEARSLGHEELEADVLNNLAFIHYRLNRLDLARTVLREALETSRKAGYLKGSGIALNRMGNVAWLYGERLEAKDSFERALAIHTELGDWLEISRTLTNLANAYRNWGDYPRAIELFLKAREGYRKVDYAEGVAWLDFSLGILHKNSEDYDKALEAINSALETYEQLAEENGSYNGVMICYGQLGDIYNLIGNPGQGLEYQVRALRLRRESGSKPAIADGLSGVAQSYFFLEDFERALDYFLQSQAMRDEIGTENGIATNMKFMGRIYRKAGKEYEALKHFKRGLQAARELSDRNSESEILEMIADLYAEQGRYADAWSVLQEHRAAQNQVLNATISERVASLQLQHEIERQAAENERLQRENRIKGLQLARSRTQSILLILLIIFAVLGGIAALYLHRKRVQIKTLQGLIPICAHCKSVRTDSGFYEQLETYISANSDAEFSHGICPSCYLKYYPEEQQDTAKPQDEA